MDQDKGVERAIADAGPLLESILASLDVGVVLCDPHAADVPILYVNEAFEQLTGYPASEAVGRNCRFLHGSGGSEPIEEALATHRTASATVLSNRRDGTEFWNEMRITPIRSPGGELAYLLGLLTDVSAQVAAEEQLKEAERRYRSLVEHLPVVTYVARYEADARLVYISPQVEAITGYPPSAWTEDPQLFVRSLHPEDRARVLAAEADRMLTGVPLDIEYRLITRTGETVWIHDRDTLQDEGGERHFNGVLIDVTALREAEERLRDHADLHRSVLSALGEGTIAVGADGTVLDVNAAASRILGMTAEELARDGWWSRLNPTLPDGSPLTPDLSPGAAVRSSGRPADGVRMRVTRPDGEERWVDVSYQPLRAGETDGYGAVVVSFHDVSERRRAEEEARLFTSLVELSSDFIAVVGLDDRIMYLNEAGRRLVGLRSLEDARAKTIRDFHSEPAWEHREREVRPAIDEGGRWEGEGTLRHFGTGTDIPVRASSFVVNHHETGEPFALATVQRDIGDEREARASIEAERLRYQALFEGMPFPTYTWQRRGDDFVLVDFNRVAGEWTGGRVTRMVGQPATEFYPDSSPILLDFERCYSRRANVQREMRYRLVSTGDEKDLLVNYAFVPPDIVLVHTVDISERVRIAEQLRAQAEHDALTGLHNRRYFEVALANHLAAGRGAVIVVDVDHFKFVNDSLGHGAGDDVLKAVAAALRKHVRGEDVVARLGGDEFAVLLKDADTAAAELVAGHLLTGIRDRVGGMAVTASAGVAAFSAGENLRGGDPLVAADVALYQAKERGRDRVHSFGGRSGEGFTWLGRVRAAIDEERFVLHAQPIVDLSTSEVVSEELLVRMLNDDGSLIPPGSFLPTAEQFGLMRQIDRWVVRRGIEYAAEGHRVELNLSARSLSDLDLPGWIGGELARRGVDPADVTFEFTETAAISSMEDAAEFTRRLASVGCVTALDDFGTGFGSFILLKHLPVALLKIDMEFVRSLSTSEPDQRIVASIVHIARQGGMRTIAEGVEDAGAAALLRELGVDFAQGYHVGRPQAIVT